MWTRHLYKELRKNDDIATIMACVRDNTIEECRAEMKQKGGKLGDVKILVGTNFSELILAH